MPKALVRPDPCGGRIIPDDMGALSPAVLALSGRGGTAFLYLRGRGVLRSPQENSRDTLFGGCTLLQRGLQRKGAREDAFSE